MQFENKPHEPDKIPAQFTPYEIDWLCSNRPQNVDAQAYHDMMARLMQARRDAVGDRLPKSVADLPLTPDFLDSQATIKWSLTMSNLREIENEHCNDDRPDPCTVAVELTAQDLKIIGAAAAFTLQATAQFDPFASFDHEDWERFNKKPETPEGIIIHQEVALDLAVRDKDMATGLILPIITYWQDNPTQP